MRTALSGAPTTTLVLTVTMKTTCRAASPGTMGCRLSPCTMPVRHSLISVARSHCCEHAHTQAAVDPSGRHASVSQRLPPRVGQAGAPTRPPPMLPSTLPVTDLIDALPPVPARRSTLVTPVTSRPTSRGPVSPNGDTGIVFNLCCPAS